MTTRISPKMQELINKLAVGEFKIYITMTGSLGVSCFRDGGWNIHPTAAATARALNRRGLLVEKIEKEIGVSKHQMILNEAGRAAATVELAAEIVEEAAEIKLAEAQAAWCKATEESHKADQARRASGLSEEFVSLRAEGNADDTANENGFEYYSLEWYEAFLASYESLCIDVAYEERIDAENRAAEIEAAKIETPQPERLTDANGNEWIESRAGSRLFHLASFIADNPDHKCAFAECGKTRWCIAEIEPAFIGPKILPFSDCEDVAGATDRRERLTDANGVEWVELRVGSAGFHRASFLLDNPDHKCVDCEHRKSRWSIFAIEEEKAAAPIARPALIEVKAGDRVIQIEDAEMVKIVESADSSNLQSEAITIFNGLADALLLRLGGRSPSALEPHCWSSELFFENEHKRNCRRAAEGIILSTDGLSHTHACAPCGAAMSHLRSYAYTFELYKAPEAKSVLLFAGFADSGEFMIRRYSSRLNHTADYGVFFNRRWTRQAFSSASSAYRFVEEQGVSLGVNDLEASMSR